MSSVCVCVFASGLQKDPCGEADLLGRLRLRYQRSQHTDKSRVAIVDAGVDNKVCDEAGRTPLLLAVMHGHIEADVEIQ